MLFYIFIAHRGNTNGPNELFENSPVYIQQAINNGFEVEIDLRVVDNKLYLGHDCPDYLIDESFLKERVDKLWIHAKNVDAVKWLHKHHIFNWFWHNTDEYTITSKGFIWAYPGHEINEGICVMPENSKNFLTHLNCIGVCSDFVNNLRSQCLTMKPFPI